MNIKEKECLLNDEKKNGQTWKVKTFWIVKIFNETAGNKLNAQRAGRGIKQAFEKVCVWYDIVENFKVYLKTRMCLMSKNIVFFLI